MDNKAQTMVLESVLFAVTLIIALIFLYQLSPSSTEVYQYTSNLKIQGDDALRSLYTGLVDNFYEYSFDFPSNKLVYYLINDNYSLFISDLNDMLPLSIEYNIYISNGIKTVFWCNSYEDTSNILEKIEPVTTCHYIIGIAPEYLKTYDSDLYDDFQNYDGSSYDLILELWSLP